MPEPRKPAIRKVKNPPEKASMTLLQHVDRCPFSAALYCDYKGGTQTAEMARGELIHAAIERCTKEMQDRSEPMIEPEVAKDFGQAMIEERTDLAVPAHEQEAVRVAMWNWGAATVLDLDHIVCVESMLEMELGNWTIRGKIDRAEIVDTEAYVRDYKTGKGGVPSREDYEHDFQTAFYALLVAEGTLDGDPIGKGVSGFHLIQEYPRITDAEELKPGDKYVTRYAFKDRQQVFDLKRTLEGHLAKLDRGFETGEWVASPGSHCARCPAASQCPIPAELRPRSIGSPGEALEVGQEIVTVENKLKQEKASLKAWVDEFGSLIVGDEVFEFGFQVKQSIKRGRKDDLIAAMEAADLDPAEFFDRPSESTPFRRRKLKADEKTALIGS